jgi:hypothetical protein
MSWSVARGEHGLHNRASASSNCSLLHSAVSREFPDHCPFVVTHQYVRGITAQWRGPVDNLCDEVYNVVSMHAKDIVNRHFSEYQHGGLQQAVT